MVNKLFIYGTLSDVDVQKKVWGRVTMGYLDSLGGFRKSEIEIEGEKYFVVIPDEKGEVKGLVIEVSDIELEKIDQYETDNYKRIKVVMKSGTLAWIYIKA